MAKRVFRRPLSRSVIPLTLAEALIGLVAVTGATNVHALAFGPVRVISAVGQPLQAEIELLDVREPPVAVRALPTSQERDRLFDKALGHDVKTEIVRLADGRFVLRLTSSQSIQQNVLKFALQVDDGEGVLARDFSLQLPAAVTASAPPAASAAAARTPAAPIPTPAAPTASPAASRVPPKAVAEPEPASITVAAPPVARTSPSATHPPASPATGVPAAREAAPTDAGQPTVGVRARASAGAMATGEFSLGMAGDGAQRGSPDRRSAATATSRSDGLDELLKPPQLPQSAEQVSTPGQTGRGKAATKGAELRQPGAPAIRLPQYPDALIRPNLATPGTAKTTRVPDMRADAPPRTAPLAPAVKGSARTDVSRLPHADTAKSPAPRQRSTESTPFDRAPTPPTRSPSSQKSTALTPRSPTAPSPTPSAPPSTALVPPAGPSIDSLTAGQGAARSAGAPPAPAANGALPSAPAPVAPAVSAPAPAVAVAAAPAAAASAPLPAASEASAAIVQAGVPASTASDAGPAQSEATASPVADRHEAAADDGLPWYVWGLGALALVLGALWAWRRRHPRSDGFIDLESLRSLQPAEGSNKASAVVWPAPATPEHTPAVMAQEATQPWQAQSLGDYPTAPEKQIAEEAGALEPGSAAFTATPQPAEDESASEFAAVNDLSIAQGVENVSSRLADAQSLLEQGRHAEAATSARDIVDLCDSLEAELASVNKQIQG